MLTGDLWVDFRNPETIGSILWVHVQSSTKRSVFHQIFKRSVILSLLIIY